MRLKRGIKVLDQPYDAIHKHKTAKIAEGSICSTRWYLELLVTINRIVETERITPRISCFQWEKKNCLSDYECFKTI